MQKIFLFLSTDHIGGAENRFAGLWKAICETETGAQTFLVISPKLFTALSRQEGSDGLLSSFQSQVIQYDLSGNFKHFRKAIERFTSQYTDKNDILHFVGDHPLLRLKRKQIYSITQSSLKNLNLTGRAGQLAGVFLSDITDVLDPVVFLKLRRFFFYKRKKIYRTSNSFCDVDQFSSLPFEEKKDWLVFLGRFEPMKQVEQLLRSIPLIYEAVRDKAKKDLHFFFFGHGSLENALRKIASAKSFEGLPLTISYNSKPEEILSRSKIFFSLQLHNNYPSKSLIEAMSAGNIPVVTNVGQTSWLAKPGFSYYVPEHFTSEEISNAIKIIYNENSQTLSEKSRMARQLVIEQHTIKKMSNYYLNLYSQLLSQ